MEEEDKRTRGEGFGLIEKVNEGYVTRGMFWNDLGLPVCVFKGRDDGR